MTNLLYNKQIFIVHSYLMFKKLMITVVSKYSINIYLISETESYSSETMHFIKENNVNELIKLFG